MSGGGGEVLTVAEAVTATREHFSSDQVSADLLAWWLERGWVEAARTSDGLAYRITRLGEEHVSELLGMLPDDS